MIEPLNSSLSLKVRVSLNVSPYLRIIGKAAAPLGSGLPSKGCLAMSGDIFGCINRVGWGKAAIGF